MKRAARRVCLLLLGMVVSSLLGSSCPASAREPTLVRLAFWVPPERMEEFDAAYAEQVAPLLKKHELVESSARGRTTVDSVFSRLFAFATLDTFFAQRYSLWNDPAWQRLREHLGEAFGVVDPDGFIRCQFVPYQCPAVAERSVPAGGGTRRGVWRTFGVQDGLSYPSVRFILQDRDGHLWFTGRGMITRYDGATFVTFVTSETLTGSGGEPLLQDRNGHLWFTGLEGVTRYDGETFITFTAADGLAGDIAISLLQDRNGYLWFGFDTGLMRYDGKVFQTFTTHDGLASVDVFTILEDRDGILWFGGGHEVTAAGWESRGTGGVAWYDGKTFGTWTGRDSPVDHTVSSMLQDSRGHLWFGGESQVTRYDGKRSQTFTTQDGLVEGRIVTMLEDRSGDLWFGSSSRGISRFDEKEFTTFTTDDGLPDNQLRSIIEDEEGYLWVGTHAGLSRYEGSHWVTFTPSNGLPNPYVFSVLQDRTGTMWFGTQGGLVWYDGEEMVTFTAEDGLAEDLASYLVEDLQGNLWIKGLRSSRGTRYDGETFNPFIFGDGLGDGFVFNPVVARNGHVWFPANPSGAVRYDGQGFSTLTTDDGLISNSVFCLAEDRAGNMWFGTPEGVSRYDGKTFTSFTRADGMGFDFACSISEDQKGNMWFGSPRGTVARYDGSRFETFTVGDGLKPGIVGAIFADRRGHIWFGNASGIVRYDGLVFQDLHHRDGLVADTVQDIIQDRDGNFWISTDGGVTRYTPSTIPPAIRIKEVIADRSYDSVQELALPSSQHLIQFIFQGRSFSTPPDRMVYVHRLLGYEDEWQPTRQTEVRYTDLPSGDYVFEVRAVDRDLNYSEPVAVRLTIHPPYRQLTLIGVLCVALVGFVLASGYGIKRRRDLRQAEQLLMQEMEEELQTAHDLQMGLMPTEPPRIEGLDIAGRCLPANHVGGDFFQYFAQDGKLAVCLADVTGHAMEAAVPVMMFTGILESEIGHRKTLEDLFSSLNRILNHKLPGRTFVCFTMGEIDLSTHTFHLANSGGCPSPYHYCASTGEVIELEAVAYPLGVRADTHYSTIETQLEPGDYVVFCSDGITEMGDPSGEIFGFGRTAETIHQACAEDLSAEALIDRLIGTVKDFAGDEPQGDDMTVVVLKVEV